MPIYIYKGNNQVSTNAVRNNKAVKAIYAKEQGQEAVCVWGINLNILPFTYTKSETSITITGLKSGVMMKHLRVPETVEDLPVTQIAASAFKNNTRLEYIRLPDSLKIIGSYAFEVCSGLTSVTIGNGVAEIGNFAFANCDGLTSVHISDITKWCAISFANSYANPLSCADNLYLNGVLVTDLVIPNSVTYINTYAFLGCHSLTSIVIPNSVTGIGSSAFYNCKNVTSITIPDSVTDIGEEAFYGCSSLGNITIPNGITTLRSQTFQYCTGLTSIVIPKSVTRIRNYVFYGCSGLTSITFTGTIAQWSAIPKGERWNEKAGDYTVHCTDGDTNV